MLRASFNVGIVLAIFWALMHFSVYVASMSVKLNTWLGYVFVGAVVLASHGIHSALRLAAGK